MENQIKKRVLRRFHYHRLKRKRRKYWFGRLEPMTDRQAGIVASTPLPCSESCCGNPRKYFNERTIQERRNEEIEET